MQQKPLFVSGTNEPARMRPHLIIHIGQKAAVNLFLIVFVCRINHTPDSRRTSAREKAFRKRNEGQMMEDND